MFQIVKNSKNTKFQNSQHFKILTFFQMLQFPCVEFFEFPIVQFSEISEITKIIVWSSIFQNVSYVL